MKKKHIIVVLLIALIALTFCAFWLTKDNAKKVNEEDFTEMTFSVKKVQGDIKRLTLTNPEGVFRFEKENGVWMNVFSEKVKTNGNTINALESIVKETLAVDLIEENVSSFGKYGLDNPPAIIEYVASDGETGFIKIGDSVIGTKYYFTVDNSSVYTMDVSEAGLFMVGMGAFSDLTLTGYKIEDITKITLGKDGEEIIVEKKKASELSEDSADALFTYALRSPVKENASPNDVQMLFERVANIGASGYNPYAGDDECGFTGSDRYFSCVVKGEKGKFILGNPAGNGYTYLKKEGETGAYKVLDDVISFMDYTAFDLVDKHIALFYFEEVSKITIEAFGEKYEIKIGDSVTVNGNAVETEVAQEFFRNLISLCYDGSVASVNEPSEGTRLREVRVTFDMGDSVDVTDYVAYDAMHYAVERNGAREFIIQRKFVEKILSLIEEL